MAGVGNNCNRQCREIYPNQNGHIKQRKENERILGSKGQFCSAFYHVHEWNHIEEQRHRQHFCLDNDNCIIAKEAKECIKNFPKEARKFAEEAKKFAEEEKKFAKEANQLAKEANQFALEADQFALEADQFAKKRKISAEEAKQFVEKAKQFVKEAKQFVEKAKQFNPEAAKPFGEKATKFDEEAKKAANPRFVQPKTVVAVVKFEKVDGRILYEARYTNCVPKQKHAEDFFKEDIENQNGVLAKIVKDNPNGTITMYLTLQPCNKSTSIKAEGTENTERDQSCCDILEKIVRETLRNDGRNINLSIKTAHTNRLSLKKEKKKDDEDLRLNALRGIQQLMRIEGVNVSGMTSEDWDYLVSMTKDFEGRQDLDRHVQNTLEQIPKINLP